MDNGELISLLESLLSPATAPIEPVRRLAERLGGVPDDVPDEADDTGNADDEPRDVATPLRQPPHPGQVVEISPALALRSPQRVQSSLDPRPDATSLTGLLTAVMPVGIALVDAATTRVQRANAMLLSMLGRSGLPDDVTGCRLAELLDTFTGSDIEHAFAQALRTRSAVSAVVEVAPARIGKQPTFRRCTLSPVMRGAEPPETVLVTLLDVTEQARARERLEGALHQVREHERVDAMRAEVLAALNRGTRLPETLARVAEAAGDALGDGCGIFLADAAGYLRPWALYARDPLQLAQLRASYGQHPLLAGEGFVGQAAYVSGGTLRVGTESGTLDALVPERDPLSRCLGLLSAACVPVADSVETIGALLLFSTRRAVGGSDYALTHDDMRLLQEFAAQLALHIQNERLRYAYAGAEVLEQVTVDLVSEGIAVYDQAGRLHAINAEAQRLLSSPQVAQLRGRSGEGKAPRRQYLDAGGRALAEEHYPWFRALRGERVGADNSEQITVLWPDGASRVVQVRAEPVVGPGGDVSGAVVRLREVEAGEIVVTQADGRADGIEDGIAMETQRLPRPAESAGASRETPALVTSDLGTACARVARAHGGVHHRRLEVRMPKYPIPLPLPEYDVERVISALIDLAASALPERVALAVNVWLDMPPATLAQQPAGRSAAPQSNRRLSAGPARISLSFPQSKPAESAIPAGIIHVCAADGRERADVEPDAIERLRVMAGAMGGTAWKQDDPDAGTCFVARLPLLITTSRTR